MTKLHIGSWKYTLHWRTQISTCAKENDTLSRENPDPVWAETKRFDYCFESAGLMITIHSLKYYYDQIDPIMIL